MEDDNVELHENSKVPWQLRPHQFKPGDRANPHGRPKGSISLKEYARKYLMEMTEDEKIDFMKGLDKVDIWKLAEGNPASNVDLTSKGLPILQVSQEILDKNVPSSSTE